MSSGLTAAEAGRRLAVTGPNAVPVRRRISVGSSVVGQVRDPLMIVLIAACALTVVVGDVTDAAVIAFVVVVNSAIGVVQEVRADKAISALGQLITPEVRVRRGGTELSVPAVDLVPGDVVLLGEGDVVPADCELLAGTTVLVDESTLTGESVAVAKEAEAQGPGAPLMSGTVVVKGRGVAVVVRTGPSSALGQVAALMESGPGLTPLQRRLAGLGRVLALVAVSLSAVVLVQGLLRGQPLEPMLVTAISLTVAAVPESLPAVVTLALALGSRRMARRRAIVRRLAAVETLGSVTVLATDKTGTLTQARMVVEELWTPLRRVTVDADWSAPEGVLASRGSELDLGDAPDVADLLRAGLLCNDARLVTPSGDEDEWSGLGDPTEVAFLVVAAKVGLDHDALLAEFPRIAETPFESATQQMVTAHRVAGPGRSRTLVVSKGAVEALFARHRRADHACARDWDAALEHAATLAAQGFRVLAVTAGELAGDADWSEAQQDLLGLVAMADPTKPAAAATIEQCRRAGIVPVLITGDHPATAVAVARRTGILDSGEGERVEMVATGHDLASGAVGDLTVPRVFARVSPRQKLDIIEAWQARGAVVAMTGDGVNDGPALRSADIGVAMGHRGTEVARQAADLVLADDDLATVVAAVEEGRRVYSNVRRFLVFGMAGGTAEILVMLAGPFVGLAVPLLAAQILWVNLLTHGVTGVAMGAEPAADDLMDRAPRPPEQSVLADGLWQRVVALGTVMAAVTLALGVWAQDAGRPWQSMVFVALASMQLGVALGLRPRQLRLDNPVLLLAVLVSLLLAVAGVYVPLLQSLLGTEALAVNELALAVGIGAVGWAATRWGSSAGFGRSATS